MFLVHTSLHHQSAITEPPDEDTEEIKKRRKELVLKHRLFLVSKSLGAKLAFIVVLALICFHGNVRESYLLNTLVKTYANKTFLSKVCCKLSFFCLWINTPLHQLVNWYPVEWDGKGTKSSLPQKMTWVVNSSGSWECNLSSYWSNDWANNNVAP